MLLNLFRTTSSSTWGGEMMKWVKKRFFMFFPSRSLTELFYHFWYFLIKTLHIRNKYSISGKRCFSFIRLFHGSSGIKKLAGIMNNLLSISDFIAVSFFCLRTRSINFYAFSLQLRRKSGQKCFKLAWFRFITLHSDNPTRENFLIFDDWFYCERTEVERTAR